MPGSLQAVLFEPGSLHIESRCCNRIAFALDGDVLLRVLRAATGNDASSLDMRLTLRPHLGPSQGRFRATGTCAGRCGACLPPGDCTRAQDARVCGRALVLFPRLCAVALNAPPPSAPLLVQWKASRRPSARSCALPGRATR